MSNMDQKLRATNWYEWDGSFCVDLDDGGHWLSHKSMSEIRDFLSTTIGLPKEKVDDAVYSWGIVIEDQTHALLCYMTFK